MVLLEGEHVTNYTPLNIGGWAWVGILFDRELGLMSWAHGWVLSCFFQSWSGPSLDRSAESGSSAQISLPCQ